MIENTDRTHVARLLQTAGIDGDFTLHPLPGGGNNRVYRVESSERHFCLKVYFQHPDDPRDRLGAEYGFLRFAWDQGLRSIPEPVARDAAHHLGLYEFIDGHRPAAAEIGETHIQQALALFSEVNQFRHTSEAHGLSDASESCFSLSAHIACIARRIERLQALGASSNLCREAGRFVQDELASAWSDAVDTFRRECPEVGMVSEQELPPSDRCLSPSDFGFHNALVTTDGRLRFLDFEYAGWDDPAKMVCDFFCQVAVPVSMRYFDLFSRTAVSVTADPERHRTRIRLLFPMYRLKWCCILLNDFLPDGSARRGFAAGTDNWEERTARQLEKARTALKQLWQ